ncbi:GNAT family N-acetyltransferase [Niabella aquatica]
MIIQVNNSTKLVINEVSHAIDLFTLVDHNRLHLSRFLPWVPHMLSVKNMENYLLNCTRLMEDGLDYSFNIFHNGQIAGRIGLSSISKTNKSANIGYWLAEQAQGKGIMCESVKKLVSFAFERLQLYRLEIKAATGNQRSKAIPEQLGFTCEGILRGAEWVNDEPLDLMLYSLLRSEWGKE